jgi:hypothetical protein
LGVAGRTLDALLQRSIFRSQMVSPRHSPVRTDNSAGSDAGVSFGPARAVHETIAAKSTIARIEILPFDQLSVCLFMRLAIVV